MIIMHHWPFYQLDIKNVFLHGDLDGEVYMEQPLGFILQELSQVYSLHKALYGLKKNPRARFGQFGGVI